MKTLAKLLEQNRGWAASRIAADPHFFEHLCEIQKPGFLWIGCSDSRVPANQIVGLDPGEMFVHRNIANLVQPGDANGMAVVQYAIEVLEVRHVIVCGHYGCGGVRAALDGNFAGAAHVERWLTPLFQLAVARSSELDACATYEKRWDKLGEMNVFEQVERLVTSDVLSRARARGIGISVHGLIYSLRDGLLRPLTHHTPDGPMR